MGVVALRARLAVLAEERLRDESVVLYNGYWIPLTLLWAVAVSLDVSRDSDTESR